MTVPSLKSILEEAVPSVQVVDVGAMTEGYPRYEVLLRQRLARLIGFEPNPEEFQRLSQAAGADRKYYPYLIGRGGRQRFYQTAYPGCSSLYPPNDALINLFTAISSEKDGNFEVLGTHEVDTFAMDNIVDLPPVDYLKIDVQGAEFDVLAGATKVLDHVLVIDLEVEFVPLYKDQPLFCDVQSLLRERGFVLHKLFDLAGRCFRPVVLGDNPLVPVSQLLWADAVFVRDFTALERLSSEQLLKQALVLHDLYVSYDLAHYLLVEYDRRSGTEYAPKYGAAIAAIKELPTCFLTHRTQAD